MSQRLNSFFANTPELRQCAHSVQKLAALQRHYRHVAPPSLLRASRVHWFEHNILTLAADNAAVAAKLRQLAPQLALQFQQRGAEVTVIKVAVQVTMPHTKKAAQGHTLGATGRQQIDELAQELPDSPLKQALQRLSRTSR